MPLWKESSPWARENKRQPVPGDRFPIRITDLGSRTDPTAFLLALQHLDKIDMANAMWEEREVLCKAGRLRPWKAVPSPEV